MKLGLISDLHGDPVALELAWAHLTVLGADRIVCAGDLVGYGPFPDRVVAFLASTRSPPSAATTTAGPSNAARASGTSSAAARRASNRSTICDASLSTSLVSHERIVGVIVHGSPRDDMEFVNRSSHPPGVLRELSLACSTATC